MLGRLHVAQQTEASRNFGDPCNFEVPLNFAVPCNFQGSPQRFEDSRIFGGPRNFQEIPPNFEAPSGLRPFGDHRKSEPPKSLAEYKNRLNLYLDKHIQRCPVRSGLVKSR